MIARRAPISPRPRPSTPSSPILRLSAEQGKAVRKGVRLQPFIDSESRAATALERARAKNPERPGERPGGNAKVGLARRQPTDLDGRRALAAEYRDLLDVEVPIVFDTMENAAWEGLGAGPNVGVLLGPSGVVEVKHGWFDGETMDRSIEHYLQQQE